MSTIDVSVIIVPIGKVDIRKLEYLKESLKLHFSNCTLKNEISIPKSSYVPERKQYNVSAFLSSLAQAHQSVPKNTKLLGITAEDLFTPGLNFVFGQAQMRGSYAVISISRLNPRFYRKVADQSLFQQRIVKEAVHELGHTLGLKHCPNRRCVMHFSNSLMDTDIKSERFCSRCLAKLK